VTFVLQVGLSYDADSRRKPWATSSSDSRDPVRANGQLPPAAFRIRAAVAAVDDVEDEAI
jgi:hypothetical protein